jgi:oligopeptide transport system permease protein
MLSLVVRDLLAWAGTVLGTSLAFGGLLWVTPGGPGSEGGPFLTWWLGLWAGALRGDLGLSYRGQPVAELILRGLGETLPNLALALVLSLGLAAVAVVVRWRFRTLARAFGSALRALSLFPVFLLAYLALVVFAVPPEGPWLRVAAILVLALGDGLLADLASSLQAEYAAVQGRDFVDAARLRGEAVLPIVLRHLALPVAELLSGRLGFLLGGVLVLEMALGIQGLGLMGYRAARHGDFSLLLWVVVVSAGVVGGAGLTTGALRRAIDPRARSKGL